jgi:hypothetical protein
VSAFEESGPSDVVEAASITPPSYSEGAGCVAVYIDGIDVTNCALSGTSTRRLNRPSQAQVRLPMDCAIGGAGSILKIYFLVGTTYELHHHGRVLVCETEADEDFGYTVYNSYDPMEMWQWRIVRDDDCDFSQPTIIEDYVTGPEILEAMLHNSDGSGGAGCGGPFSDCIDVDREFCEGPLFLDYGTFETGGCDLTGAPTDWPMSIGELTALLVSTGCLDVVITPTDPGGGIMGEVSAYNGDFGSDLTASVDFDYGQGNYNIRQLRWNQDMSNMTNKLWYFMGPKILTPSDPAGDQHWCYNVTGDDTNLPDPTVINPKGTVSLATLLANRLTSRSTYGARMDIQIFDAGECSLGAGGVWDTDCCGGNPLTALFRELYRSRWEMESWIRQQPRNLVHITPTRGTEIGTFDIGDLVGVSASSAVRGGFSGAQRVYEYSISWEDDGVCFLSELQTSDTADS